MKGQQQLFSSAKSGGSGSWGTPQAFYDLLNEEFNFTLDPCADASNAKAPYFSIEEGVDGLQQDWSGQRVFCNFPYSQAKEWAAKCVHEAYKHTAHDGSSHKDALVVVLCAARTDARWWHQLVAVADEVRFIKGRLAFVGPDGAGQSATFPSSVIIIRPGHWQNMELRPAPGKRAGARDVRMTLWELPSEVRRDAA